MHQAGQVINQMINISEEELDSFLDQKGKYAHEHFA